SERPKAENSPVKRGANGEVIVTLDAATRTRIGLKVDIPAAAQWRSEIKGYGRALDPAPIAALITDLVSAHLTTRVSQQELERLNGVTVPRAGVVRHDGKAWVYVQAGDDSFSRREITLDRPTENGWFIFEGVTGKERLVVGGAQTILSEELSGGSFMSGARD